MKMPFCEITFNCEKSAIDMLYFLTNAMDLYHNSILENLPSRFELLFSFTIPHDNTQNAQFISNLELAIFLQVCQRFDANFLCNNNKNIIKMIKLSQSENILCFCVH